VSRGAGDASRDRTKQARAARIPSIGAAALANILPLATGMRPAKPGQTQSMPTALQPARGSPGPAGSARRAMLWTCRSLSDDMLV
jgi:hypothetical protein